jgi:concanavalin A-like lectin/glucanase superfamily protein
MSYKSVILADAPLAYYRLDEQTGLVAADSTANGNNGTITGTGVILNSPGALSCDPDACMVLDGVTGAIALPAGVKTDGLAAATFECWFNLPNPDFLGNIRLMSSGDPGANNTGMDMAIATGGAFAYVYVGNGTTNASVFTGALNLYAWYHMVATYDGANVKLYQNGVQVGGNSPLTGTIGASALNPFIGRLATIAAAFYGGQIDEVAIYNYALTSSQVQRHYQAAQKILYVQRPKIVLRGFRQTLVNKSFQMRAFTATQVNVRFFAVTTEAGAGTLTGTFSLATALTDTLAGAGTLTGTTQLATALTDTLAGVGTLAPTLSISAVALSGTLAGAGTLTGTTSLATALTETLAGVGTLSGTAQLATVLADTLTGVGTLTASLGTTAPVALSVTCAGVGTLSGTFTLATALTETLAGVGTLTGTFTLATHLTTTIPGVGTLTPTMQANTALTSTCAGVGTLSGTATLTTALISTLVGVGTLSGTTTLKTALSVTMAGVGTLSGTLSTSGAAALSVTMAGVGTETATALFSTVLTSTCSGASTLSGVFTLRTALFLTCAGVGALIPSLVAQGTTIQFLTATWVTRDGNASWNTRDGNASWNTRDELALWKAR